MASDLADRILAVLNADPHTPCDTAGKLLALNECITQVLMLRFGDDRVAAQTIAETLTARLMERICATGVNSDEFLN
jgi:hypothetical protein